MGYFRKDVKAALPFYGVYYSSVAAACHNIFASPLTTRHIALDVSISPRSRKLRSKVQGLLRTTVKSWRATHPYLGLSSGAIKRPSHRVDVAGILWRWILARETCISWTVSASGQNPRLATVTRTTAIMRLGMTCCTQQILASSLLAHL